MRFPTTRSMRTSLQQLMETDEYDRLRVWTSDVEKERCLSDCEEDFSCH